MAQTRIVMPATAAKGSVIEIKTLIQHVMETGYRRDLDGRAIARDIIKHFAVTYAGEQIFACELFPAMAANPFISFTTTAIETGDVVFTWSDEKGETTRITRRLTVT